MNGTYSERRRVSRSGVPLLQQSARLPRFTGLVRRCDSRPAPGAGGSAAVAASTCVWRGRRCIPRPVFRRWLLIAQGRRGFRHALNAEEQIEVVARYAHDHEAHLAAGALTNAGIRATVATEEGAATPAYFPQVWRVLVHRRDLEAAIVILAGPLGE